MQAIANGDATIVVAGGQESMSLSPHAHHMRAGTKMGDVKFVTAAAAGLGVHGPGAWVLAVTLSYLLAATLAAIPRLLTGRRHEKIPLGPYLVGGHLIVLLVLLLTA